MPEIIQTLQVNGTIAADSNGTLLVLSERLGGHDTFLTGQLQLGDAAPTAVRILTFDDVTVLRLLDQSPPALTNPWAGVLHLPHGWRARSIPEDLSTAATAARRDLRTLDEAELRYALTFLGEASTDAIRRSRIHAIVRGLPTSEGTL
ncbi:hypothetical protein [Micromonospora tulbaghiae]|uniref:hypothetical protein n=1 Tax=Micromonospora tulbaghiae TaxID=479978 RepID=UPI0013C4D2A9|nr:hypothetical protein [Micromonospora tulbaghiae]